MYRAACRNVVAGFLVLLGLAGGAAAQEAESWLGLPVTYQGRSYTFTPWPAIEVRALRIATANPILIDRATVTPDWGAWITEFKTQRLRMHANQVTASPDALLRLSIIDGRSTRKLTVLRFNSLRLLVGGGVLELPAGQIDFAADGTLAHLKIALEQGPTIDVAPQNGKLGVMVQASSWRWAGLSAFLWESLVAQGELTSDGVLFDRIGGNAEGGSVRGTIRLAFGDKVQMSGELKLDSLRAASLLARLFPRHPVQGTLSGNVKIAAQAPTLGALGENLVSNGSFLVKDGSIDRFGLLEGMRKAGGGAAGGGLTRFDTLSGTLSAKAGQQYSIGVQRLDAGALQGSGNAQVAPDGSLKGFFSGSLRLPGGESSSRGFALTGSVESPTLMINN